MRKYELGRKNIDTGRKCWVCGETIFVSNVRPIVQRESVKYCGIKCKSSGMRLKSFNNLKWRTKNNE